jgi:hypothetical protein
MAKEAAIGGIDKKLGRVVKVEVPLGIIAIHPHLPTVFVLFIQNRPPLIELFKG